MVAYSFKTRFAAPILAGTKAQTIRGDRKRHARPGEPVQLFTGMRTKHCRQLGEPVCIEVVPVALQFTRGSAAKALAAYFGASTVFKIGGEWLPDDQLEAFAQADGFASVEEMAAFWFAEHSAGDDSLEFYGVLIRWQPLTPADPLDIGAAG